MIGVACERARLPHLIDQPFILASDDGIVKCASPEARAQGIRRGLNTTTAVALCEHLIVLPYDQSAYTEAAETIWDVIAVETSSVEPIDAELCYAEFDGPAVIERINALAASIAQRLEIPIAVGVGATKLVARAAAQRSQPQTADSYVVAVGPGDEAQALTPLPLAFLDAIDAKLHQRLTKLGITTIGALHAIPPGELERQVKDPLALRLRRLAVGLDSSPVRRLWPQATIEQDYIFDDEVRQEQAILQALQKCSADMAAKLRACGKYCRALALTVQLADGAYVQEKEYLYSPTHDTVTVFRIAGRLLNRLRIRQAIQQVRLTASGIDAGGAVQLTLLNPMNGQDSFPHERQISLNAELCTLRRRYGPTSVISAALLQQSHAIHLWTYALTKRHNERVRVITDPNGSPIRCFRNLGYRQGARHETQQGGNQIEIWRVTDRWRAAAWSWGKIVETDAYRVMTSTHGAYELQRIGDEWRLRGIAD
ncbi:hypothetical protein CCAX7_46480 [Capsulimonas corticalis]|uniref:Uncharacterized protein n=1 Tax=Capsulimonas corticalis TaxID=2219043 RepID=A0A402D580_9BACT|nr:hypothetical protein CCAX7_46480 [Capsulimonas corticalis]